VKANQKTLHRPILSQFQGNRKIPFVARDHELGYGRDITCALRAKQAPEHITEAWIGTSWIVDVTASGTRDGKPFHANHIFITSLRTTPDARLRLIRYRWSIETEWHSARDVQLGEDTRRYANRIGVLLFAFLRTIVMTLLRHEGYRSIRQAFRELAYNMKDIHALGGATTAGATP
jgi:predicted transposase YbfD/YdcC